MFWMLWDLQYLTIETILIVHMGMVTRKETIPTEGDARQEDIIDKRFFCKFATPDHFVVKTFKENLVSSMGCSPAVT